ncbi:class II aldolase/adducin family protein [Leifsonia sp. L25]|uniref:class II aldolase/adducin family protein n=1 Tax=Leifsonia sp. L25 TaxID=3423957 RepID=UPI003D69BF31
MTGHLSEAGGARGRRARLPSPLRGEPVAGEFRQRQRAPRLAHHRDADRVSLRAVTEDELAATPAEHDGAPRPAKELPLHAAMYAAHPDATAVVHLHSPYATAIACLPPGRAASRSFRR